MKVDHVEIWAKCLDVIKDNINHQNYATWFEPIEPLKLENNVLTIQVPSQFFYEWLEEHYVSLLRKTIKHFLGPDGRLEYSIIVENSLDEGRKYAINIPTASKEINTRNPAVSMPINIGKSVPNPFVIPGIKKINIDSQLNPNYTFENFMEGDCNRLARAAGYAVATKPGQTAFNPLLVYGGTGLGKTHLAQAIGNEVKGQYPNKIVLYVSSEKFINQFIESTKNNTVNDFISFYQLIDVLIVDDIQFFSGKEKTQDHFFHVFNHLHQAGKQIVLTSDCAPKDLKGMEERLLSRFKWGLSADLQTPDYQTRVQILRNKMYKDGIELPSDVIEYIAHNITSNVRELEGALISLLAQSSLNKREVDLDLAKQMLKNFIKNVSREISIDSIQKLVCEHLIVDQDLLKAKTRKREVVQARQISMFFAKELTKASLKTIGMHFGGRDHSTVIHAVQTVNDLISIDKEFRRNIDEIKKKISLSLT
jgi:chromosomal replication initiator protein